MKMLWRVMAVSLIMCMLSGCGGSLTGMGMSSPLTETDAGDSRADQESKTAETDTSGADSVETENGDNGVWGELSTESAVEGITSEDGQGTYPTYQVEIGQLSGELVKEVLLASKLTDAEVNAPVVWFAEMAESALRITAANWFQTKDWGLFCAERENIQLELLKRFAAENLELAFNTQTVHIVNDN